jgi:uncharacterized protein (DUF2062 family)
MNITTFLILVLATYRLTSLLLAQQNSEAGPYDILDKFRHLVGVRYNERSIASGLNVFAEMLCCVYCLSVWTGLVVGILYWLMPVYTIYACLPLALSAGAIMVQNVNTN